MGLILRALLGVSILVSSVAMADSLRLIVAPKSFKGYQITNFPKENSFSQISPGDINKYLPSQLVATDSSQTNLRRIGDKAMQVWIKSPMMQQFSVVQTAQVVERAMKAEVAIGGQPNPDSDEPSIQHKVNFQIQAFQALSKVDYKGYVNASLTYNMKDQTTGVEVRERILRDKDLYVNHTSSRLEDLSTVGIKWDF